MDEELEAFLQLMQWHKALFNGLPVTVYFTVPQRQEPLTTVPLFVVLVVSGAIVHGV
jgi:hypothetical protein